MLLCKEVDIHIYIYLFIAHEHLGLCGMIILYISSFKIPHSTLHNYDYTIV